MLRRGLMMLLVLGLVSVGRAESTWPTGQLVVHGRVPKSLGHEDQGYVELYEFGVWLNAAGPAKGYAKRCGESQAYDGSAQFAILSGTYGVLVHQPEWSIRPSVVPGIALGRTKLDRDVMPGLDYSVACGPQLAVWRTSDSKEPWEMAAVFHQTFVAKGTSVTHAAYRLAGSKSPSARLSIHKVDASHPPEQWEQIGPERLDLKTRSLNDNWVGWRSGEVPTVPGETYALRIEAWPRGKDAGLTLVVHRDSLGHGYDAGTAYANGAQQAYDIHGIIGSDSDGKVIPYMRVFDTKPGKFGDRGVWAQTWVAQGHSLAGANFLLASKQDMRDLWVQARVHEEIPTGKPVGIAKTGQAACWVPASGWVGVVWQPGEVPLEPGKAYCIVWNAPGREYRGGIVNHPANTYLKGMAFRDGKQQPDADLEMTLVEYSQPASAATQPAVYEPKGPNLLTNGDFQQGKPSQSPTDPPGWARWQSSTTTFWYGPYGRNKSQAIRMVGGNINGTKIDGGLVQRIDGLSATKTYRLWGWVSSSMRTDLNFMSAIGYDPTGQTTDAKAASIIWEASGRDVDRFEQVVLAGIQPKSDSVSIWLRAANKVADRGTFTVDFDDLVLEEVGQ